MTLQQNGSLEPLGQPSTLEPLVLSVIANRFESVVRNMRGTLLRSARSTVINTARDFSCSIVTVDNELLAAADGLPVHVIGSDLLARSAIGRMADLALIERDRGSVAGSRPRGRHSLRNST